MPYKHAIGNIQSFCLVLLVLGSIEVGCLYTSAVSYILMTTAFYEMVRVSAKQEKEDRIQIKTKWMELYSFLGAQFFFMPQTWLTQELLNNSGIELSPFLHDMLFKYHPFYTFCLFALGMILFVFSLEEGFYAYQFKQLGWSIINLMVICTAGHGFILSLWRVRIWFVYPLLCMVIRDSASVLISHFVPLGPSLHELSPKLTVLGYIFGAVTAFGFYFFVSFVRLTFLGC